MEDKAKRLRKILVKRGMKGKLKPVGSLEEAHIILVDDSRCASKIKLIGKDSYLGMVENGYTFPEEIIYFTVSSNPRDKMHIEQTMLSNAFATTKSLPKK